MMAAMKIMGKQFVLGRNMKEALKNSEDKRKLGYTHSYDMLGEAALTRKDAEKYYTDYANAITGSVLKAITKMNHRAQRFQSKLSALAPRYRSGQ